MHYAVRVTPEKSTVRPVAASSYSHWRQFCFGWWKRGYLCKIMKQPSKFWRLYKVGQVNKNELMTVIHCFHLLFHCSNRVAVSKFWLPFMGAYVQPLINW